ncbi:hypothetical protein [Paraburkholderia fungorum]|uniref:Uncharacterized protein n=1 Tax=Paraburkholderia fungorum TaxID=134537 RepID=A0A3R7IN70_9BURK|nr:hypothetical protein [Paraburkholderia fungorum]RKF47091.1 hypothetical protein BCY88_24355 [Paraburkholderia fungorum]
MNRLAIAQALAVQTGNAQYFEGTLIPTSIVIVLMLCIATLCNGIGPSMWFGEIAMGGGVRHLLTLVIGLSGSLMISRIRIPKI